MAGEEHIKALNERESHKQGCVTKHMNDWCTASHGEYRCSYRGRGYTETEGNKGKRDLYEVDFTKAENAARLPRVFLFVPKFGANTKAFGEAMKAGGPLAIDKVFHQPRDPRVDKEAWWFKGRNYKDNYLPFNVNYHHILPKDVFNELTPDECDLIQQTGYNLNEGFNLIILPRESTPGHALMLPIHPDNHLVYTEDVKAVAAEIKSDVTLNTKDHKLDPKSASALRTKLESWEKAEFSVLVDYGRSEAAAGRPSPKLDGAPMASASGH